MQRSMHASMWVALALFALALPSHPAAALSIVAGECIMVANFFFLARLVKLFTERDRAARALPMLGLGAAKTAVVYGGAFALTRWRQLEYLPLLLGLSMPLLAALLKSIMAALGFGASPIPRRATQTAGPPGPTAKLAAVLFLAGAVLPAGIASAQAAGEHGESGQAGVQHLPNWVVLLNDYFPNNPVVHWMHENEYLVFAWLAGIIFLVVTWVAMRRPKPVPGQLQNAIEWMVESMEDVCGGLLGKHAPRYLPFIFALFFYILTMNLLGIIPGFMSATSTLDLTLALAIVTFLYVQFSGIRNLGFVGYIDHLAGSPRDAIGWAMLPVMLPVHILGELAKPVSL
ncbi:MAG TPA: F0F1 ATP synthase subunit A, partial [Candidatus Eisenbacteria bacterium]